MFILAVLLLILLLLSCLILSLHCGDPSASMHTQSDQTQIDVGAQLFTIQGMKHVQRNFLDFRPRLNPVILSVSRTWIDTPRMLVFLSPHHCIIVERGDVRVAGFIPEGYIKADITMFLYIPKRFIACNKKIVRPFVPISWLFANWCGRLANPTCLNSVPDTTAKFWCRL